jgi:hypothetical protein
MIAAIEEMPSSFPVLLRRAERISKTTKAIPPGGRARTRGRITRRGGGARIALHRALAVMAMFEKLMPLRGGPALAPGGEIDRTTPIECGQARFEAGAHQGQFLGSAVQ